MSSEEEGVRPEGRSSSERRDVAKLVWTKVNVEECILSPLSRHSSLLIYFWNILNLLMKVKS
jgi:hypothetical protein